MTASAWALRSPWCAASAAVEIAGRAASRKSRRIGVRMVDSLTFETGGRHLSAFGVLGEEHGQVDRGFRSVLQFRQSLLAEAVADAPLHRAHLALRYAVGRPSGVSGLRVRAGLGEVGQLLQADALADLPMAGGAGEIVRGRAIEEDRLARFVGLLLLRMIQRQAD